MMVQTKSNPHTYLTVIEAAKLLRLSRITLDRWRTDGKGPQYYKFGAKVVYAKADLIAWADTQVRTSTSEE